jgi:signal transduction histidine kinase
MITPPDRREPVCRVFLCPGVRVWQQGRLWGVVNLQAAMQFDQIYDRYQQLQRYVGWTESDARRVARSLPIVQPSFPALIDDFYAEIDRHEGARKVITGGEAQIQRLKGTLSAWLTELFSGRYDRDYVDRRWRVGYRHVEIGLAQVYTNVALSRLRRGLLEVLNRDWSGDWQDLNATKASLNTLLDLDLALIEEAYQVEYQLRQQRVERLATIGQVAGGIAHELRNPLNVVKTSVYYLLNARNPSEEKVRSHLDRIDRQVGMADGVITALHNFARLPLPELQAVPIASFLEDLLELTGLPENIEVNRQIEDGVPPILGDPHQLRIAFGNLIRNARDAMPDGGQLTVAARERDGVVHLDIRDTGKGIPPEDQSRILEPLYTTKARGIGLGLSITRAIVEKHEGQLSFTSEPGQGTTFTVSLPAERKGD